MNVWYSRQGVRASLVSGESGDTGVGAKEGDGGYDGDERGGNYGMKKEKQTGGKCKRVKKK